MHFILICVTASLAVVISGHDFQVESLKSLARRTGGVAVTHVNREWPSWTLEQIARSSSLIVRGRIVAAAAKLTEDESLVFTDYTVQPVDALKIVPGVLSMAKPGQMSPIVFQQLGGTVTVDGLVLTTSTDDQDPDRPIKVGDDCFLFLSAAVASPSLRARANVFEAVTGPLGIFPIREGKVENFTRHLAVSRAVTAEDPVAFGAAIRALVATEKH